MKKIVIIGGTKGIGFSIAKRFAKQHIVTVVGRRPPTESFKNIDYVRIDLLNAAEIYDTMAEIRESLGKIHYLLFFQRFRSDKDPWEGEIQVSLSATKTIIEIMEDSFDENEASIVLTSSVNSTLISNHLPVGYHVAKAGLVQMARYYSTQLGHKGIRVNSLSLGTIFKEETKKYLLNNTSFMKFHLEQAPLRRVGTVEDVANVVEFLCCAKSSFVTGQDFALNGGVSNQWQEALAMDRYNEK